jgi:hypothetical protein
VDLVLELFELVEQLLHPSPHLRCPMILSIVLVMIYHRWRIIPLSYAFVILPASTASPYAVKNFAAGVCGPLMYSSSRYSVTVY